VDQLSLFETTFILINFPTVSYPYPFIRTSRRRHKADFEKSTVLTPINQHKLNQKSNKAAENTEKSGTNTVISVEQCGVNGFQ
jgi:hypothetical protein